MKEEINPQLEEMWKIAQDKVNKYLSTKKVKQNKDDNPRFTEPPCFDPDEEDSLSSKE